MGSRYRVLTVANIITLGRLGLLGWLVVMVGRGDVLGAAAVFLVAWALDAVDGAFARAWRQETKVGYLFDKIVDRLLLVGGGLLFISEGLLPTIALLLFTKDVAAAPAAHIQMRAGDDKVGSGWAGKVSTLLQGLSIVWLLLVDRYEFSVIIAVALFGGIVGTLHLYRVVYK
ncbi:MAG: CDP-alcohol phosphatidyltransferase family protein [Candidatus Andersenbacteria bacterium]